MHRASFILAALLSFCFLAQAQTSASLDPLTLTNPAPSAISPRPVTLQAPTQPYSHGDPTAEEQLMLEIMNRARANPTGEGQFLAGSRDPAVLSAYRFFGVDTNLLKTEFSAYPVRPPLAFHPSLLAAARRHSQDMAAVGFQGHEGSDDSTFRSRVEQAGYINWNNIGENVFAHAEGVFHAHAAFNVDWGVPSLGHRRNIMNFDSAVFNEIGIAIVPEAQAWPEFGPLMVTQDFGRRSNVRYLVGVVYRDSNGDGFYSVGEGVPNVTVMPSEGTFFAVTSTSGGYAIPYSISSGSWTVTISGGTAATPITKSVALGLENKKIDFELNTDTPAAPVAFRNLLPSGKGFQITGPAGQRLVVQASADLAQWSDIATVTLTSSGAFEFSDARPNTGARMFYRAKLL